MGINLWTLRSKLQKQEIKTDDYIHSTDSSSSPYPQQPKRNKGISKFIRILGKKYSRQITHLRKVNITIHMLLVKDRLNIKHPFNDFINFIIKQRLQLMLINNIVNSSLWNLPVNWIYIKIYNIVICPFFFFKWCTILLTVLRTRSTFLENLVKCIIVLIMNLYQNLTVSK